MRTRRYVAEAAAWVALFAIGWAIISSAPAPKAPHQAAYCQGVDGFPYGPCNHSDAQRSI